MTTRNADGLRLPPRDPMNMIWIGVGLGIVGGLMLSIGGDAAAFSGIVLLAAGVIGSVGIIAQGIVVGMRRAFHEEYLNRLMDASADADVDDTDRTS